MPNPVVAAEALRGAGVERLLKQVASIQRDIDAGINGINGWPVPYLAERRDWLGVEKQRLEAEIKALSELGTDELVARFNPPPPDVEPIPFEDVLKRGESGPKQVILSRETLPDRRSGGNPAPVQPSAATFGHTYGYRDGQLVRLD